MPIVLLGGIYSGAFTPTEAAAVAALHALLLSTLVFRALSWRSFWTVVLESARGSAVITLILAGSFMLNYALTAEGVPQAMADSMEAAVEFASASARTGDAVLMSPACASLDMFRDYAHRAQVFCDAVRARALAHGNELEWVA
jgi:UDP-N-acetylmuramoylalanine-D-glutamate ligase